jgi:multidrug transporter EmrE-like cation transporter
MAPILWILSGGITLTIGDVIFRFYWSHTQDWWLYVIGLSVYLIGLIFLVESYKYQNIAVASAAVVVSNIVLLSIVSWFYFGQKFTVLQGVGLVLAIVVIFILEIPN